MIKSIKYDFRHGAVVVTTELGRQTQFTRDEANELFVFLEMDGIRQNPGTPVEQKTSLSDEISNYIASGGEVKRKKKRVPAASLELTLEDVLNFTE